MKLMTLAVAVVATVACVSCAQARTHHHSRRHYSHEATRHVFRHQHWARRGHYRWREAGAMDAIDRDRIYRYRGGFDESLRFGDERGYRHAGHSRFGSGYAYGLHVRYGGGYGARPREWCGWEMRHLVGGDPGPSFNLARNWAHWGRSGPAGVGAVVVWPHHVGKIVGRADGEWVIESGNDGNRLRVRPRSIAGAIAVRWG
jgi:hypothetical protein